MLTYQKNYQTAYGELFTDLGKETLDAVWLSVSTQPKDTFTWEDVKNDVLDLHGCADGWKILNALDQLVTACEIIELTAGQNVMGQDRKYRRLP